MKFKKGDVVYYADSAERIKKATIKCVHRSDPSFPYELDITASNRFYPADAVFATEQEAEESVQVEHMRRMSGALENEKSINITRTVPLDDNDPHFDLSDKQKKELEKLCEDLDHYCTSNNIPYLCTVVFKRQPAKGGSNVLTRCTSGLPGRRTPDWLYDLWDIQCDMLGMDPEGND